MPNPHDYWMCAAVFALIIVTIWWKDHRYLAMLNGSWINMMLIRDFKVIGKAVSSEQMSLVSLIFINSALCSIFDTILWLYISYLLPINQRHTISPESIPACYQKIKTLKCELVFPFNYLGRLKTYEIWFFFLNIFLIPTLLQDSCSWAFGNKLSIKKKLLDPDIWEKVIFFLQ